MWWERVGLRGLPREFRLVRGGHPRGRGVAWLAAVFADEHLWTAVHVGERLGVQFAVGGGLRLPCCRRVQPAWRLVHATGTYPAARRRRRLDRGRWRRSGVPGARCFGGGSQPFRDTNSSHARNRGAAGGYPFQADSAGRSDGRGHTTVDAGTAPEHAATERDADARRITHARPLGPPSITLVCERPVRAQPGGAARPVARDRDGYRCERCCAPRSSPTWR